MTKEEFLAIFNKKVLRFEHKKDMLFFLNKADTFDFNRSLTLEALFYNPREYDLGFCIFVGNGILTTSTYGWYEMMACKIFLFRSLNE